MNWFLNDQLLTVGVVDTLKTDQFQFDQRKTAPVQTNSAVFRFHRCHLPIFVTVYFQISLNKQIAVTFIVVVWC